jgi:hypothetical protein
MARKVCGVIQIFGATMVVAARGMFLRPAPFAASGWTD